MKRTAHATRRVESKRDELLSSALIWVLFGLSCLVLAWFVSVVNEFTERGEQRRIQQRTTGSLVLADEQAQRNRPQGSAVFTVSNNAANELVTAR
ncbi:hypothetical protein [Hydrogenophaga palleronii]|uniref:hypothetical protein n=1 Tax=Hydrogenophaga palleronii TaxID=65655 RepID=UPI000824AC77|nr:hypothetical protein [Hydrogenophaga palleronii]